MKRFPINGLHLFNETKAVDRLEVLEGPTGRRTWSDQEKARIVLESFRPGALVGDVARANGMAPQHLSTWRSLARKGKLAMPVPVADDPFFAAVEVTPEVTIPEQGGDWIEVCVGDLVVRLPGHTDAGRVAEIVAALRAP